MRNKHLQRVAGGTLIGAGMLGATMVGVGVGDANAYVKTPWRSPVYNSKQACENARARFTDFDRRSATTVPCYAVHAGLWAFRVLAR